MAIKVICECGKRLVAPDKAAGREGRCPTCNRLVLIPEKITEEGLHDGGAADDQIQNYGDDQPQWRVIIADADESELKNTCRMFEDHGYSVVWKGADSAEVIDKARELAPDVIVLDETLKGLKGFQVVGTLTDPINPKNEKVWRKLFVMTTNKMRGRDKQYALSLGIEIFVDKPLTPTRIFPRIERRLRRQTTA